MALCANAIVCSGSGRPWSMTFSQSSSVFHSASSFVTALPCAPSTTHTHLRHHKAPQSRAPVAQHFWPKFGLWPTDQQPSFFTLFFCVFFLFGVFIGVEKFHLQFQKHSTQFPVFKILSLSLYLLFLLFFFNFLFLILKTRTKVWSYLLWNDHLKK